VRELTARASSPAAPGSTALSDYIWRDQPLRRLQAAYQKPGVPEADERMLQQASPGPCSILVGSTNGEVLDTLLIELVSTNSTTARAGRAAGALHVLAACCSESTAFAATYTATGQAQLHALVKLLHSSDVHARHRALQFLASATCNGRARGNLHDVVSDVGALRLGHTLVQLLQRGPLALAEEAAKLINALVLDHALTNASRTARESSLSVLLAIQRGGGVAALVQLLRRSQRRWVSNTVPCILACLVAEDLEAGVVAEALLPRMQQVHSDSRWQVVQALTGGAGPDRWCRP
jgi:hypothetical protein